MGICIRILYAKNWENRRMRTLLIYKNVPFLAQIEGFLEITDREVPKRNVT